MLGRFARGGAIALAGALACGIPAAFASAVPPRTNGAWVYDPKDASGQVVAGAFVDAIRAYNLGANGLQRVRLIYSYGGDMEMYCPHGQGSECSSKDLYVFYSRDAVVYDGLPAKHRNASAVAYATGLASGDPDGAPIIAPVIDGSVGPAGTLAGFNELSPDLARAYADKVAWRVCTDPTVDGIEFDLEPFDVSTDNGQYRFYLRIARDFASRLMQCVDDRHPNGRFFAIFGSANALRPGTTSSQHVAAILNGRHNGYWIDPLYDLASAPSGWRTSVDEYRSLAGGHAANAVRWAQALGVHYQFGVPAAASYHEYADCTGSACAGADAPLGGQIEYVTAAQAAIDASAAPLDPLFLGTALWSWTSGIGFGDTRFGPSAPAVDVERLLGGVL